MCCAAYRTLAGVRQVSVATGFPLRLYGNDNGYWIEGQPEPQTPGDWPGAVSQAVGEDYHHTLGIGLITGRFFTERDTAHSPPVIGA